MYSVKNFNKEEPSCEPPPMLKTCQTLPLDPPMYCTSITVQTFCIHFDFHNSHGILLNIYICKPHRIHADSQLCSKLNSGLC